MLKIFGKKNVSFIWKFGGFGIADSNIIDKAKLYSPFEKLIVSLNNSLGVRAVR